MKTVGNTVFSSAKEADIKIKDPVKTNVKLSAYWIGHSSTLLQIYDKVFLLDPVFNDVVSGCYASVRNGCNRFKFIV